jgi:hypothetical protein
VRSGQAGSETAEVGPDDGAVGGTNGTGGFVGRTLTGADVARADSGGIEMDAVGGTAEENSDHTKEAHEDEVGLGAGKKDPGGELVGAAEAKDEVGMDKPVPASRVVASTGTDAEEAGDSGAG